MKKIIFLFICLMTLPALPIFALEQWVSISVSSPTIVVPSVTPSRNWSDNVSDPLWQEVSFYVYQNTNGTRTGKQVVSAYFQHSQQSYWPASIEKQTILTTIKNSLNAQNKLIGLNGLLNFDTVNTKNVYDSQVPVRLNIDKVYRNEDFNPSGPWTLTNDHYYVGKETAAAEKWEWKYIMDRGAGGPTPDDLIWGVIESITRDNTYGIFRADVKLRIGFSTGKYAGTYLGNLIFFTQTQ